MKMFHQILLIFIELKFTDLDTCSEYGYGGSDFSEDEINLFPG